MSQALLNKAANTPDFKAASLTSDRLSGDAAQLIVDFIQRPVIRQQLQLLGVGTILGKKRRKKPLLDEDGNPTLTAKKKTPILISEDTGRRVKTRLSTQQTEYMQERFAEKPRWKPQECEALLKELNALGPDVTADQAYRWFDNRRNKKNTTGSTAANDDGAATAPVSSANKTSRISRDEREMLETAYAQDCAPDVHKRAAIAAMIGISTRQVTNWFARRQTSQRPAMSRSLLANVDHGGGDDMGLLSRLLPVSSTAVGQGAAQMILPGTLATQGDLGLGIHQPEMYGNLSTASVSNGAVTRGVWGW